MLGYCESSVGVRWKSNPASNKRIIVWSQEFRGSCDQNLELTPIQYSDYKYINNFIQKRTKTFLFHEAY